MKFLFEFLTRYLTSLVLNTTCTQAYLSRRCVVCHEFILNKCNQIYTIVIKRTNKHFHHLIFLSPMSDYFTLEVNRLEALNPFGSYA